MNVIQLLFLLCLVYVASLLLTGWLRHYAVGHAILDLPNIRSSHTRPIPKGGGLAIVVTFLVATIFLTVFNIIPRNVFIALLGGGIAVALIGWLTDRGHVAVSVRLFVHFLAVGWALYWLGDRLSGILPFEITAVSCYLGLARHLLVLLALVWLINLYNFMDGIDGLAAVEAISVSIIAGILLNFGYTRGLAWSLWVLAASTAGLLFWNWPPARIFMGDVGSCFLGFVFGVFILASAKQGALSVWPWLILLGVFLIDAAITLFRRIIRGSRWHEAHRRHAYQHAARRWGHKRVTLGTAFVNLFWLAPLAWGTWRWPKAGFGLTVVALIPLVITAFYFKAGEELI